VRLPPLALAERVRRNAVHALLPGPTTPEREWSAAAFRGSMLASTGRGASMNGPGVFAFWENVCGFGAADELAVLRFGTLEDGLTPADDVPYGLAAYVFTADLYRPDAAVAGLDAGMIGLSDMALAWAASPFGGVRSQGMAGRAAPEPRRVHGGQRCDDEGQAVTSKEPLRPGVWGVLATPLTADGSAVDTLSLARQVQYYARIGAAGLTVLGVFGEAARLTPAERRTVVETVVAADQQLPFVVGISALEPQAACAEAENVLDLVDGRLAGLMVQVASADPAELTRHLTAVAARTGQGIVVQDYPVASGVSITTPHLVTAVRQVPSVVAVKSESSPSPPAVAELVACVDVPVFGGLGGTCLLDELAVGAAGAMTGFSVPEGLLACLAAHQTGGFDAARDVWRDYLPLVNFEFQRGIALGLRKHSLVLRGLIRHDAVRPPATAAPPRMLELLAEHLRRTPGALRAEAST
jgi:4-hydroxy-tetrahydrodipicolinate synthase